MLDEKNQTTTDTTHRPPCCGFRIEQLSDKDRLAMYRRQCDTLSVQNDELREILYGQTLTDPQRDIVRTQALAMLGANTEAGVTAAAGAAFFTVGSTHVSRMASNVVGNALDLAGRATDSIKDAFSDPTVRDAFVASMMSALAQSAAPSDAPVGVDAAPTPAVETVTIGVQVNGKTIGTVAVPVNATSSDVVNLISVTGDLTSKILPGKDVEITDVEYKAGKVIRFTTNAPAAPAVRPKPAAEPKAKAPPKRVRKRVA